MRFLILISILAGLGLAEPQNQHLAEAPMCPNGGESCLTDDAPQVCCPGYYCLVPPPFGGVIYAWPTKTKAIFNTSKSSTWGVNVSLVVVWSSPTEFKLGGP